MDAAAVKTRKKPGRRYGGRSPDERIEERRRRLLDTALTLFCERGYAKTPIETLCQEAKVTTRHFYQQFKGREALLAALYDEIMTAAFDAIDAALLDESGEPLERVEIAVGTFIHFSLDDPRRARLCMLETVGVSDELEQHRRAFMQRFAARIAGFCDRLAEAGLLPRTDYRLSGVAVVGAIVELLVEALTAEEPPDPALVAKTTTALLAAMIRGAANPSMVT